MVKLYDYLVIGGGISGLQALDHIVEHHKDRSVALLEKRPNCGGMIKSFVEDDLIHNLSDLHNKYIIKNGKLHDIPKSVIDLFKTPLLSWKAKILFLREILHFVGTENEITARDFGNQHFGKEFTENIFGPVVFGKSFGELDNVDILSVFPELKPVVEKNRSVLRYLLLDHRSSDTEEDILGPTKEDAENFVEKSVEFLNEKIFTDTEVEAVYRKLNVTVVKTNNKTYYARNLVFATPAFVTAKLLYDVNKDLSANLKKITYADIVIVQMKFKREDISHLPKNMGFVTSCSEGLGNLCGVVSSDRGKPEIKQLKIFFNIGTNKNTIEEIQSKLASILEITKKPIEVNIERIKNAVPQYNIGHRAVRIEIERILDQCEDIFIVGNYLEGITVEDVQKSAQGLKEKLKEPLPKLIIHDQYLKPYHEKIRYWQRRIKEVEISLVGDKANLSEFSSGHHYYGLHRLESEWVFREWAPNATKIFLVGDFCGWQENEQYQLDRIDKVGNWEIRLAKNSIKHLDLYKLSIHWEGGRGDRIPSYANYVVQDEKTHLFSAKVWSPSKKFEFKSKTKINHDEAPLIYEAHVGMAQLEGRVGTYKEFKDMTLPRIKEAGYNTVQLMAVQEHPYYGSFGYQVSSFFASSSRCGTPDELKELIDEAHKIGLRVIMDIVHSHAVRNENEGLALFDGTHYQYFHEGGRGYHPAWDTMCFDYQKPQVLHFLLSNCKYWIEEFNFDGYRFDGVTSMLYLHHGLGKAFMSYDDYFNNDVDEGALIYLALSNKMLGQMENPVITIAEDMSGMPGLGSPLSSGGIGFGYRLGMGIPDFWIKLMREFKDEDWNMDHIWHELTNFRQDEKIISYVESHDQALVGDKTNIFWLIDKDMYTNMAVHNRNLVVDRGIALHKMIKLITIGSAKDGYLNFMGNEFGHPEWVDFPREGNNWSYHYARRQWNLRDNHDLCYKYLAEFDKEMVELVREYKILDKPSPVKFVIHNDDHVIGFERGGLFFIFNFDPLRSFDDYMFDFPQGAYEEVFNSDRGEFGGFDRYSRRHQYKTFLKGNKERISLYLPLRTALVLRKI